MKVKACIVAIIGLLGMAVLSEPVIASETLHLKKVKNNLCDKASLQRGAALYMNYCSGCHELKYARFEDVAKGIGIVDADGKVLEQLVNENLNFVSDKVTAPIQNALSKADGEKWFGIAPPDLSLVSRSRGKDWLYTYLHSFYEDANRPWGVNNVIFPDVGMPHILLELQGIQTPVYKTVKMTDDQGNSFDKQIIDHLVLQKEAKGALTPAEYDQAVTDLVNFLEYIGEPHKLERQKLGVWVLLFLVIFTLFAYLLKREFWKDVH